MKYCGAIVRVSNIVVDIVRVVDEETRKGALSY